MYARTIAFLYPNSASLGSEHRGVGLWRHGKNFCNPVNLIQHGNRRRRIEKRVAKIVRNLVEVVFGTFGNLKREH